VASHFLSPKQCTKGLRYLWRLLGLEGTCYDLGYDNYKITLLRKCWIFGFVVLINRKYLFPCVCRWAYDQTLKDSKIYNNLATIQMAMVPIDML
jgi:hypothetical protein